MRCLCVSIFQYCKHSCADTQKQVRGEYQSLSSYLDRHQKTNKNKKERDPQFGSLSFYFVLGSTCNECPKEPVVLVVPDVQ